MLRSRRCQFYTKAEFLSTHLEWYDILSSVESELDAKGWMTPKVLR